MISDTDLSYLRNSHPHAETFYLSVLHPSTVYIGTVTGAPARGARTVTLSDVSGNKSNIVAGQTAIVYTTSTGAVISKRRVRSMSGQVMTFDENNVAWSTSMSVKILKNWELWSVFPYIDLSTKIFYKDRDIVYSDQNTLIPPVAIIKGDRVGFLDGPSIVFNLTGSGSYAMAPSASITSYHWESDSGGTFSNANVANPTLTMTAAGQFWLYLTVTDSNNKTQTQRVPIFVHTRTGDDAPFTQFELSNFSTSWDSGGASFDLTIFAENAGNVAFPNEGLVILWSEQFFDGEERYMHANGNVLAIGYLLFNQATKENAIYHGMCRVGTIQELMGRRKMTSVSLEESSETASWYRFPVGTLTPARAVHHLWKWHSTLFDICNVYLPITVTKTMYACDDFENGSLYEVAKRFTYDAGIFANVCCNTFGDVHVEQDLNILSDSARAAVPTFLTVLAIDRELEPDLDIKLRTEQVSVVQLSGIGKNTSGDWIPIISSCPGEAPDTFGDSDKYYDRQVLEDQDEANYLSGRVFATQNTDIIEIQCILSGNYPVDIVPQQFIELNETTNSRLDLEGDRFIIRDITWEVDVAGGVRKPTLILKPEAISVLGDGVTVTPPTVDQPPDQPYPDWPPIDFPRFPPIPFPPAPPNPPKPGECIDESNGPWHVPAYSDLKSWVPGQTQMDFYYYCRTHDNSYANKTQIVIDGGFWKIIDGNRVTDSNNDWYEVDLLDGALNVVATATMTGSGDVRTGTFDLPTEVQIYYVRVKIEASTGYLPGDQLWYNFTKYRAGYGDLGDELPLPYTGIYGHNFIDILLNYDRYSDGLTSGTPFDPDSGCIDIGDSVNLQVVFEWLHQPQNNDNTMDVWPHAQGVFGDRFTYAGMVHTYPITSGTFVSSLFHFSPGVAHYAAKTVGIHITTATDAGEVINLWNAKILLTVYGSDCDATADPHEILIKNIFLYNICS